MTELKGSITGVQDTRYRDSGFGRAIMEEICIMLQIKCAFLSARKRATVAARGYLDADTKNFINFIVYAPAVHSRTLY